MATQRLVNTNFWKDTYIIELDPIQKLLFLYFLTNPRTTLAGVYEISIREVAFDTGIDRDMVEKMLTKFMVDEKMHYEKGWLVLRNFVKHQRVNPSIKVGIERAIEDLPVWLREIVENFSSFYDQQRLNIVDKPSLSTDSPQSEPTKPNLIELNLTKPNASVPSASAAGLNKKTYAAAVRADESLAEKESEARNRSISGSGYASAKQVVDNIKLRKVKKL